jgi:hypothetical protein
MPRPKPQMKLEDGTYWFATRYAAKVARLSVPNMIAAAREGRARSQADEYGDVAWVAEPDVTALRQAKNAKEAKAKRPAGARAKPKPLHQLEKEWAKRPSSYGPSAGGSLYEQHATRCTLLSIKNILDDD